MKSKPKGSNSFVSPGAMIITGVKMKYLSLKENGYGSNHFFNVLDFTPLQGLIELRKSLKITIWDSNDKLYLKTNDVKIRELLGEHVLKKMFLILWVYPFQNTTFKRMANRLLVIVFLKLITFIKY